MNVHGTRTFRTLSSSPNSKEIEKKMSTKSVVVCYTIEFDEKNFNKVHKAAQEGGSGFCDAGPVETVRRFLETDGLNGVEESGVDLRKCVLRDEQYIKEHQKL